uniref:Uncharacterized protein n=1 Tax=Sinocyclocheilus rhinocerous TaxID=307959 RepID=A0A673KGJ6_9TELE
MAAHRIRSVNNNTVLPRCRSEGALIDLSEGVPEATLTDFKVPSPSALRLDATASFGAVREVIAIKDYCPSMPPYLQNNTSYPLNYAVLKQNNNIMINIVTIPK